MSADSLTRSMAALEEWCFIDDEKTRKFEVIFTGLEVYRLPWRVTLTITAEEKSGDRCEYNHGQTMADALAHAASVVVLNPGLEGLG